MVSIPIPDSVTEIGEQAFYGCAKLQKVIIPNSVTKIGWLAFHSCESLTEIVLPNSITEINSLFCDCTSLTNVNIPNSVTDIDSDAFAYCTSLTTITIPDSVRNIYETAFQGCKKLKKVIIPDSVTQIYESAFEDCEELEEVVLSNSLIRIDDFAFRGCSNLKSIFIPASVEYIGYGVFDKCLGLQTIAVDQANKHYDSRDHCNAIIQKYGNRILLSCTNTIIPDSVTDLDDFKGGCYGEKSIIIPDTVTAIGGGAFEGCANLTDVTIGKSVSRIGNLAFKDCINLKTINLLHRLVRVGEDIFEGCTSLEAINIPAHASNYYKIHLPEELHDLIEEIPTKKLPDSEEAFAKAPLRFMSMPPQQVFLMEQFYDAVLDRISIDEKRYSPRETQVINGVLNGKSLKELGTELHLYSGRVREIWEKCLIKLPYWSEIIQHQAAEIERLKREILELKNPDKEYSPYLSMSLEDCDFSVRTVNCLKEAGIETVADLVKHHRADLLKFRNFGKKSLTELGEWLEAHGLSFGMGIDS